MAILKILISLCLLSFGIYGIINNWWLVADLAGVVIPLCLVIFGLVSVLAGISTIKEKRR